MTDQDTAAKILLIEFNERLMETKRVHVNYFAQNAIKTQNDKDGLVVAARRIFDNLDNISTIFLPGDALLSSAGIVPVYYWFIRSLSIDQFPSVRNFLERIEEQRKLTLKLITEHPQSKNIDQEMVHFNSFYRNPNDPSSHEGRFRFLSDCILMQYKGIIIFSSQQF
jgi:hypothetical protein